MSRPQDPQRPYFPFGNPFRRILPRGSNMSSKLVTLLNTFESNLAEKLRKLKPKGTDDILSLSWMIFAVKSLCEIHADIENLIAAIGLPVCDWDEKWIDMYLDNSVKLLDICNAFSSEISRLNQGHLFLQFVLHSLCGDESTSTQVRQASSSLEGWKKHIDSKNRRLENCFTILNDLSKTLNLPKVKNSSKGKVLMQAMYGVKVVTVVVCRILAIAFSGCAENLADLQVLESCSWAEAFYDLQAYMNGELSKLFSSGRVTVMVELGAVDTCVDKLFPGLQDGSVPITSIEKSVADLRKGAGDLSQGLDSLSEEVDSFFKTVLIGRDALLGNLREDGNVCNQKHGKMKYEQVVR